MPNHQARPTTLQFELVFPGTTLSAFEREEGGVTRHYIGGTASSTAEDLKGSIIRPVAQKKMVEKLQGLASRLSDKRGGMTAWLNHDYKIPGDCLGAFTGASLATREEGGQEFIDLDIECRVVDFTTNPRAEAAYRQVLDGIRHGWSIGAYFTDIAWLSDDPKSDDFWRYEVLDLDLLEISLVGIPANQRAWVRDADSAKAYAVACAERITADSHTVAHRRELVQRSIVEHRSPAGAERLAMAEDFRERAKQPHLDSENVKALTRAAEALESRDDGSPMSPDDMRDRISLGISHLAKAVGHGLCVKSATHISRCIDSLSGVIGANGGSAEPVGDEDPNSKMAAMLDEKRAELEQFEASITGAQAHAAEIEANIEALKATGDAQRADLESAISVLTTHRDGLQAAEELAVASRVQAAAEAQAALDSAKSELTSVQGAVEAKRAELEAVAKDIEDRKNERMGRLSQGGSVNDMLSAHAETEMKPEHYQQTHAQRQDALKRQAGGNVAAPSARDIAANRK